MTGCSGRRCKCEVYTTLVPGEGTRVGGGYKRRIMERKGEQERKEKRRRRVGGSSSSESSVRFSALLIFQNLTKHQMFWKGFVVRLRTFKYLFIKGKVARGK